jgi:hypothetical protein
MKFVLYILIFIAAFLFKLYKIWIWLNLKHRVSNNWESTDKDFIAFFKLIIS